MQITYFQIRTFKGSQIIYYNCANVNRYGKMIEDKNYFYGVYSHTRTKYT